MTAPDPARPASEREALRQALVKRVCDTGIMVSEKLVERDVLFGGGVEAMNAHVQAIRDLGFHDGEEAGWRRDGGEDTAFDVRVDPLDAREIRDAFHVALEEKGQCMEYIQNYGKEAGTVCRVVIARAAGRPIPTEETNDG